MYAGSKTDTQRKGIIDERQKTFRSFLDRRICGRSENVLCVERAYGDVRRFMRYRSVFFYRRYHKKAFGGHTRFRRFCRGSYFNNVVLGISRRSPRSFDFSFAQSDIPRARRNQKEMLR